MFVTLRFLAKRDYLSEVADLYGIPLPSASLCLSSVEQQAGQHIRFPTSQNEIKRVRDGFYRIAYFSNVVDAIDGTLIPKQGMSVDDEPNFICRFPFNKCGGSCGCRPSVSNLH